GLQRGSGLLVQRRKAGGRDRDAADKIWPAAVKSGVSEAGSIDRKRVVDQLPERRRDPAALVLGLLHHDVDHVELGIDAEISAAPAVPLQFADRTGRRWSGVAGIGPHGDAVAIAKTITGKIIVVASDAGARADMVRCHLLEGGRTEVTLAVELAAI